MSLAIYKDTLSPSLLDVIEVDGAPLDLTGKTATFRMRLTSDDVLVLDRAATIVSALGGQVRYDWVAGDLDSPGEYVGWWRVDLGGGVIQESSEFAITVLAHSPYAYADVARVMARSGGTLGDLTQITTPSLSDVAGMLEDVAAEIDAHIRARGLTAPERGSDNGLALRGCNADGALLLAMAARFPSGAPSGAPTRVVEQAEERYGRCRDALANGTHPVVVAIVEESEGVGAGATALHIEEPDYDPRTDQQGRYLAPRVYRGMSL